MDHRIFLASLSDEQRQDLMSKSNIKGLSNLALHCGGIILLGWLIIARVPFWPGIMLGQGILIIFLFTLLHETIHKTAFASAWINNVVAVGCGFLVLLPPLWFRYFHFAHHRHTQEPDKDPELAASKPETIWQYFIHVSGISVWISHIKTLIRNATRVCEDEFVPEKARGRIRRESMLMLAAYLLVGLTAYFLKWTDILYIWIIPALLGQPFLRVFLLAEHGHCPFVANMLENTRTTYTNALVRKFAWNMPYHAEHHAMPTVPFHKLPELNELLREHLKMTDNGYISFNRKYVSSLNG